MEKERSRERPLTRVDVKKNLLSPMQTAPIQKCRFTRHLYIEAERTK
jgi:hypothetical protein